MLALAAAAIKLEDGGPVFFRQERIGKDGRPFQILKLRTMVVGRRAARRGLRRRRRATAGSRGSARCCGAPRSTSSPSLVNVLKRRHEPRRAAPDAAATRSSSTREHQRRRLEVLPGVTGWAQVHGRAALPWPERIELDVWYVDHASLALDARIVWRTLVQLLRPAEVYRGEHGGWRARERERPAGPQRRRPGLQRARHHGRG